MADEIPRAGRDEAGRRSWPADRRETARRRPTARAQARIRLVGVERVDHIIAIRPRVRPRLVLVVAVRLAVVHDVQPIRAPALAVARRGQQPINQSFIGVGAIVRDVRVDLLGRRRQAMQVERQATQQRAPVGLGRVMQPQLAMLRQDERVDRRANPIRVDRRYLRTRKGSKRPPRTRLAFIGQCDVRRPRHAATTQSRIAATSAADRAGCPLGISGFSPRCSRPAGSRPASQGTRRTALAAGKRQCAEIRDKPPFASWRRDKRYSAAENRRHTDGEIAPLAPDSIEGSITGSRGPSQRPLARSPESSPDDDASQPSTTCCRHHFQRRLPG